jgi:hypothetical protein
MIGQHTYDFVCVPSVQLESVEGSRAGNPTPQSMMLPQPSVVMPHWMFCCAHVWGVQVARQ